MNLHEDLQLSRNLSSMTVAVNALPPSVDERRIHSAAKLTGCQRAPPGEFQRKKTQFLNEMLTDMLSFGIGVYAPLRLAALAAYQVHNSCCKTAAGLPVVLKRKSGIDQRLSKHYSFSDSERDACKHDVARGQHKSGAAEAHNMYVL